MESAGLSNLIHMTRLGPRGGVDMRPTLLRVLTDLYVQKLTHTPDEERHYTELALRLLDAVDVPTRAVVAARLVRHLSPPHRVIEKLAVDLPEVAAAIRARPPAQRKPPAVAPAEPRAEPATAALEPAPIPRNESQSEAVAAETDPDAIPAHVASALNDLFFAANADERRLILLNLEIATPMHGGRVQLPRDIAIGRQLETAALGRNPGDFAQTLSRSLQIPHSQAQRIAADALGEPIVIAAKALAMPRDVVYRILLFVNTTVGHSVERVHTLATLYDEMTLPTAEHMVTIWQALQISGRPAAKHQPLYWNDEARARARTATAAVRRAPATQRAGARRDVS